MLPPEDWPNRAASRAVHAAGIDWHVQVAGSGPQLLLLHGAGGATQSWRGLLPLLAQRFLVIAPDLPGQGYSRPMRRHRMGLDQMAADLDALLINEGWRPETIVGHSAGAAIALRMAEDGPVTRVIGLNAALGEFPGLAGWLFPMMAKVMSLNTLFPWMFTKISASEPKIKQLLRTTGSAIDADMVKQYARLARDRDHVGGTLSMMADWDLRPLLGRLGHIDVPVLLLAGAADGTVPPSTSERAAKALPGGTVRILPGLGHLAHEEAPDLIAEAVLAYLDG